MIRRPPRSQRTDTPFPYTTRVRYLMQGSLIEVRAAEPRRSATWLREQLKVESVGLFGDRVHVVAQHPDTAMAKAGEILRNAGLAVQSIRTIEPSLEDVFVSVLSREPEHGRA